MPDAVSPPAKVAVVTGGASGLGLGITRNLTRAGLEVVVVGRDAGRLDAVCALLRQEVPGSRISTVEVSDLALLSETRRVARLLSERYPSIDLLVNNAGAVFDRREVTADGIERTFALNVLAPFDLTCLLAPALLRAPSARVVNVSSAAHRGQRLDLNDLMLEHRFGPYRAYARSKLALLLLTREFARRFARTGVSVVAVHPGVVRTRWGHDLTGVLGGGIRLSLGLFGKSVERGAETPSFAALDPSVPLRSGSYFNHRAVHPGSRTSRDPRLARELFEACARMADLDSASLPTALASTGA